MHRFEGKDCSDSVLAVLLLVADRPCIFRVAVCLLRAA